MNLPPLRPSLAEVVLDLLDCGGVLVGGGGRAGAVDVGATENFKVVGLALTL